ncbi:hypothetical protein niasHS_000295 [Heterodera schachtii]|uniref:Uncharacterized protein n=1 Tax=Heterodera schachtii TaxID=97005 RepID=A0ABD2KMK9_HETSC
MRDKIPLSSTEDNYNVDDLSSNDEWTPKIRRGNKSPNGPKKCLASYHCSQSNWRVGKSESFGRAGIARLFRAVQEKKASSSAVWGSPMSDPTPGFGRFQKMFQKSVVVVVRPTNRQSSPQESLSPAGLRFQQLIRPFTHIVITQVLSKQLYG